MTLSIGEPKRNKDYQKAHFPKRTTDDTESQAMARFAVVEQPHATAPVSPEMTLLREVAGRLHAKVKQSTQAINRLHNLLARVFPELATLTDDITSAWVLHLLDNYPTAQAIAQARITSLQKIPYLAPELAEQVQLVARQSVAGMSGAVAETLVRDLVAQVRHTQHSEEQIRQLLANAFAALPRTPHVQVVTIPGIGTATVAVVVAKVVDINRFATPEDLVGYFGVFPEENSSGVDKDGKPLPPGTLRMSHKGNDLVRSYLWNATRSAIRHNPAIAAFYQRLKAKGKGWNVAMGHCMRKLLHLIFAVWKTNQPFDADRYAAQQPQDAATPTAATDSTPTAAAEPAVLALPNGTPLSTMDQVDPTSAKVDTADSTNEKAAGHKRDLPEEKVVTTATATVPLPPPVANATAPPKPPARPKVDYAFLRQQVSMEQVLQHLNLLDGLRGRGQQRRGPCPIHSQGTSTQPTFSAHLGKNVFQCFQADCGVQGNVLDLWAAVHHLPLYEAALHLAETFQVPRNREEEHVKGTR
jgi:transposase